MLKDKINYEQVYEELSKDMEAAQRYCIDVQNTSSVLRCTLLSIKQRKGIPLGVDIEIQDATRALQKAEWLMDYVREELQRAKQCFAMRDQNGEIK